MHTNRYLVHTLKNAPALIHYRLKALTHLVGRHSRRESDFDGWNFSCEIIHSPQIWIQYFLPFIVMPPVTTLCVNTCMAGPTEANQIFFIMCSTLRQRLDVMNLFNGYNHTVFKTLLAERMCLCVLLSYPSPRFAVSLFGCRVSLVAFISFVLLLLMFFTIATVCQLRTAGIWTRFLWFSRHSFQPLFGYIKSLYRISPIKTWLFYAYM